MKAQFLPYVAVGVSRDALVEVTHALVLCRHRHRLEVTIISDGLDVAAN